MRIRATVWAAALAAVLALFACGGDDDGSVAPEPTGGMAFGSDSFAEGTSIPEKYSCDGVDESPPLTWTHVPAGTVAFVVVMDDLDAGGFVHWIIYDVPGNSTELAIQQPPDRTLDSGAKQGKNSFGDIGYGGPCPPRGQTHDYRFRIYALDAETGVGPGADADTVVAAIQGHVLDEGQITATFGR